MNPPGPPRTPGAPWNDDDRLERGRRRTAPNAPRPSEVRGASAVRPAHHPSRRGSAASRTAGLRGGVDPVVSTRPAPVVRTTDRRAMPPTSPAARRAVPGARSFDPSAHPADLAASAVASTIAAVVSTVRGVFDDEFALAGVGPVAVRPGSPRRRLILALVAMALFLTFVLWKVVGLQVLDRTRYVAYGENQRTNAQVLAADRGEILDRNGAQMVISRPVRAIFVDPKLVVDPAASAAAIAPLLGLDVATVQARMTGSGRFAYLARKVPDATADAVAALGVPGVAFLDETERFLTAGDSARSILGGVDVDNVGISGLESQYGDVLAGTPGRLLFERSPSGRTIAVGDHSLTDAVRGDDLRLTIDRAIQFEAERLLGDQVKATGAKGGVAIVSRPSTGEVLAVANMVLDPESSQVVVSSNNLALTTQYEPGSVMKMVTIAGALEAGLVNPTTQFTLPPTIKIYDDEFGEAEGRGTVTWDVTQILTHSSNIGSIRIGQTLGKERLYETQRTFGFGARTTLGFPYEAPGSVLTPSKYTATSLPSIAIGQGISVTPMQMLFAYNTIANQGVYVAPKLVDATIDADGIVHPTAVSESHRAVSTSTADRLNLMLRGVVDEGTGRLAAINGYSVAGKTGTARKSQAGGGYTDRFGVTRYQSTFVGFVPAQQPALSVYVMLDEPSGDYSGGATAAPVFSRLGSFALNRLGIAPAATDIALGGAPVIASANPITPSTQAVIVDGDRVRALTAGSPEAQVAAAVPTTTTIRRSTAPATR